MRTRLLQAGTEMFAEKGFKGASVRQICAQAGTSMNMIHHYFGSKDGLFDAIVQQFSAQVFEIPSQLIARPPKSQEDFAVRFELFVEQTLNALLAHRLVYAIISQQPETPPALAKCTDGFGGFLAAAAEQGYLNPRLDWEMVTGFVMDRLTTQAMLANGARSRGEPAQIDDPDYRARWLAANTELFLNGLTS